MSARPRPITATFKPDHMKVILTSTPRLRTRSYDLESSSESTKSLVSVLDHDSYESFSSETGSDNENRTPPKHLDFSPIRKNNYKVSTTSESESATVSQKTEVVSHCPWEKWLLAKAKEERKTNEREAMIRRAERHEKRLLEKEKVQKHKQVEKSVKEWVEKKKESEIRRQSEEKRFIEIKMESKERETRKIQDESEKKFQEWLEVKREQEKTNKKVKRKEKEQNERGKQIKQEECEKAFDSWLKQHSNRYRVDDGHSFGYTSGQLTGYHDRAANPVPSFYNPIPWKAVDLPKTKKEIKNKTKKKYIWNPKKYY